MVVLPLLVASNLGKGGAQTTPEQPRQNPFQIRPVPLATSLTGFFTACNKLAESDKDAADKLKAHIQVVMTPEQLTELKRVSTLARAFGMLGGAIKVPKAELDKLGITEDQLKEILKNFASEYGKFSTKYLPAVPPPPAPKP